MYALQTKNLTKEFGGVRAVDGLSISFEKGAITGVVGPNGSGKTTLTNVLTGLYPIDGGAVIIGSGKEREKIPSHEVFSLGISRTFQSVRLFGQMSVLDNLLLAVTKRNILGAFFEKHGQFHLGQAEETLKRVGLWEKRDEHAENLSYGQRKLLEIARALATGAETLFFDEPFAGLFPEMVKRISGIMKELRAGDQTVILIEHDMAIIRELCDHVIVLDAGKLIAEGKPDEVLNDKRVIEAYLGV